MLTVLTNGYNFNIGMFYGELRINCDTTNIFKTNQLIFDGV